MNDIVTQVAGWLRAARTVTVLTGAGISTDSGIPDYRGPQGVWTRNPEAQRLSTLDDYVSDADVRRRSWVSRLAHTAWRAQPNPAHRALVDLERDGHLLAIVTQNVDGLHQRAGSDPDRVLEIHGTIWWAECLTCGVRTPMLDELERVRSGDEDPRCRACGGILKSATISFGQALDPRLLDRARLAAESCELFLAVGTSLTVHPAATLCDVAVRAGARLVVVNAEPTPYDGLADAVVREPIGDVLPALVRAAAA